MTKSKLNLLAIAAIVAGTLAAVSCDNPLNDTEQPATEQPAAYDNVQSIVVSPTRRYYGLGELSRAGDIVNLAGITVAATMTDSTTRDATGWINAGMVSSGDDVAALGDKTITVTLRDGVTGAFTVTVNRYLKAVSGAVTGGDDLKTLVDGAAGQTATITLYDDAPNFFTTTIDALNTVITLTTPDSAERIISKDPANASRLFTVEGVRRGVPNNARLIVDGYVTLQGVRTKFGETGTVIGVYAGARLDLQGHAKVTGNHSSYTGGGGVIAEESSITGSIRDRPILTLSGDAEISGNTIGEFGGGVFLEGCDFTMSGNAKITGNTSGDYVGTGAGGGVWASYSTFVMTGGEISGNTVVNGLGGGVYIHDSEFFFSGGVIKDNVMEYVDFGRGGGVCLSSTRMVMSGTAQITPKPDGDIIVGGLVIYPQTGTVENVYIDDRNSLAYDDSTSYVAVYGTLSAAAAALVDIAINDGPFSFDKKYLRSADGPGPAATITDYPSGAPTGKFPLDKYIDWTVQHHHTTFDLAAGGTYRYYITSTSPATIGTLPPVTWSRSGDGTMDEK